MTADAKHRVTNYDQNLKVPQRQALEIQDLSMYCAEIDTVDIATKLKHLQHRSLQLIHYQSLDEVMMMMKMIE